ncbi:hypothetical protein GE09DRAFT_1212934 [Coniochaeta sp. 2T2.1]|nr:hypothetical protein GE09DRAFT_1212934 [Coniochaeta sp. 2T2.1]
MRRVQEKEGLNTLPRPCDYFDLMAGTSTGGLIAILLGRLQMTTQEALDTYDQVAKRIFNRSNRKLSEYQFKATTLQDAVEKIVAERSRGDLLKDPQAAQRKGKAFVCAVDAKGLDVVQLFRTYETPNSEDTWLKDCKVWEAARATTAAPAYFKPVEIKRGSVAKTFIDGAVSCNNPAGKLLEEAGRVFNSRRKIGAILSIGTGTKPKNMPTDEGSGKLGYAKALFKMLKNQAVDTEHVHLGLKARFKNFPNAYFRFNVPGGGHIGLADWDRMGELKAMTEKYLSLPAVTQEIEEIADVLASKKTLGITVAHIACLTNDDLYIDTKTARPMGSPSHKFVGRRDILERLDSFFAPRGGNVTGRRQFLLCGMGGAGKTQIALKFAESSGQRFNHVFWVDAENLQTARQSYKEIAITEMGQKLDDDTSTEDVQNWIASLRDEWLLILDNSITANLERTVPVGNRGNIIYTSRDQKLDQSLGLTLPPEAVAVVNDLDLEDAITLLLKAANLVAYSEHLRQEAEPVATELGCLALAIDQAGSYIFMQRCSIADYLQVFRERRAELLRDERYKGQDPRSQAVYATFDISYRAVKALATDQEGHFEGEDARNALRILDLVCFYHNEGIPEEIFQRAALKRHRRVRKGLPHPLAGGAVCLESLLYVADDRRWSAMPFRFGVMLLEQFSLVKQDMSRRTISMHVLIHSWAVDRMEPEYKADNILCAKTILCCAIPTAETLEPYDAYFRRMLYPHAKALEKHADVTYAQDLTQSSLDIDFGFLAQDAGDYLFAEKAYKRAIKVRRLEFGLDDQSTLNPMVKLAGLYQRQARYGEAESVWLEVIERLDHAIDPDDPKSATTAATSSVKAWMGLAMTYISQSRLDAAINALLQARQRKMAQLQTSDPNHEALSAINTHLAILRDGMGGNWNTETIPDLEARLERCLRDHEKWDSRTLRAREELGNALAAAGRFDEAEEHLYAYAHGYANVYGTEDARTLAAFRRYAYYRLDQGMTPEAEDLFRLNLAEIQRLRGQRDVEAYYSLFGLGKAIAAQARYDEGILLMEKAKDLQETQLGAEHLHVTSACEGISQMVERASSMTYADRREIARRAIATINKETAAAYPDGELDKWTTPRGHYTLSGTGGERPELVYLTREERNRATRFPNLWEPKRETVLELPIELLHVEDRTVPSSEEFV